MGIFNKKAVGLDIADHSIEVVLLAKKSGGFEVLSKGRILLDRDVVERGRIKDKKKLAEAVHKVFATAKPTPIQEKEVIFGLSEALSYTCMVALGDTPTDTEEYIQTEAHKHIPISPSDATLSHVITKTPKGKSQALVLGASTEALLEWQSFFKEIGLSLSLFDVEALALYRGIFGTSSKKTVAIVDLGALATDVSIFNTSGLQHSYSIATAGVAITKEVSKALSLTVDEAEKLKKEEGVRDPSSKHFSAIIKVLGDIVKDVKETTDYFSRLSDEKVEEVILVGGTSNMHGIESYFGTNLELPVRRGQVFLSEFTQNKENDKNDSLLLYIEAIGLALRDIDDSWNDRDPFISADSVIERSVTAKKKVLPTEKIKSQVSNKKSRKVSKKTLMFIVILVVGVLLFASAFVYRNKQRAERKSDQENAVAILDQIEEVEEKKNEELVATSTNDKPTTTPNDGLLTEDINEELIVITETELGYLNVRSGPNVSFNIVTTVAPGQEFEVLEWQEDWYNIKLPDGEGWVSSRYADKVE